MNDLIQKYMDDSLLYFYSTIPQIIAAIIAFIFVFVIFKLQDYDKLKQGKCASFLEALTYYLRIDTTSAPDLITKKLNLETNYQVGYFKDISDQMTEICKELHNKEKGDDGQQKSYRLKLETITNNTRIIDEVRESLISRSIWICLYGFVLIIGSIVVLYFVKSIFLKPCLSLVLFIFFIVSASVFFTLVFRLLVVSLKNKENVRYIFNVCKTFPYIKIIKKPIMTTVNQFMLQNIEACKEIIKNIPISPKYPGDKTFDSHEFIQHFAKRFEIAYVGFLGQYSSEPFHYVNAQIGAFLESNKAALRITDLGKVYSQNVFGDSTQIENWEKVN